MKKFISIMAMAMVLLWSCQEKDGLDTAASGKVELAGSVVDGQIIAGPEGGDFPVDVTSSGEWRVSGFSEWVVLSSESGKSGQPLTFTVLPYGGDKSRSVTFKVFIADAVQEVTIIQTPIYTISLESEGAVNVPSDANVLNVTLNSNVEELEIDFGGAESWIELADVSDAFGKKIVRLNVARSQEFLARAAVVTFGGANVDEEVTVMVNQAQRDTAFVIGEQRIIKGLEAMSLDLVLKSNVDVTYTLPTWLTRTLGEATEKDETGLQSQEVKLSAEACAGSRSTTLSFRTGSAVVGSLFIKQQNPNPTYVQIPDENLRTNLESQGWILQEDGAKCELLESGMIGTTLVIGDTYAHRYSPDPIRSIDGLESFPNLESLTLGSLMVEKVDVSAFPKLNELKMINLNELTEVNTGSRPITDITNTAGSYTYTNKTQIVISGDNIENINFSSTSYYVGYYELALESIDVTGCPNLKTLNVNRAGGWSGASSLKYVYMTAAQLESVAVTKQDAVELVVK